MVLSDSALTLKMKETATVVWLNVAWIGWKNTSLDIRVCKRMWEFQGFNFVQPRKQNPRYLYVLVSLLDTRNGACMLCK